MTVTSDHFWASVDQSAGPRSCWPWTRSLNASGYGQTARIEGERLAHRAAWALTHGRTELYVLHDCDNPPCCNPEHLFEGTHADNMADMWRKGRGARGGSVSSAKLSDSEVMEMRSEYATGHVTARDLAPRYGVSVVQAQGVVSGRFWAHLPLVPDAPNARADRERLRIERAAFSKRKLSEGQEEEVLDLHGRGWKMEEIADMYSVSKSTVSRLVRLRAGLRSKSQLTRQQRLEVVISIASGESLAGIAEKYGVSRQTVWRIRSGRS